MYQYCIIANISLLYKKQTNKQRFISECKDISVNKITNIEKTALGRLEPI